MTEVRTLAPGDEAAVERFLAGHAASSMFLRSNLRARGVAYRGQPMEAVWVAAIEGGEIVGIAAHCWNDNLLLQAPRALPKVARAAVEASGRPLRGFLGPWEQIVAARAALGLSGARADVEECEDLYLLNLADLSVPQDLASERVHCARATGADRDLLVRWRIDYHLEALGRRPSPSVADEAGAEIDLLLAIGDLWVLRDDGRPVACTAFNARLPDCVQVGGVWTPPDRRSQGYARAAVAGSLLDARSSGVRASVLFTKSDNVPACRAYASLGYAVVGDYGLVLLSAPNPAA